MKTIIAACLLAFSFSFPGLPAAAAGSVVVDRVVAVVNGDIITMSDLQREEELRKAEGKIDRHLLLDDMIDRRLQMAAAKREGLDVSDKELAEAIEDIRKRKSMDEKQFEAAVAQEGLTFEQYRTELREQMTLSRVFNKNVRSGVAIDEAEARAYYDRNAGTYALPEEVRLRQMFFRVPDKASPEEVAAVKQKATAALERARKGENFATLVRELSDGANAALGGDLGFLRRDQALPEIEQATRTMKPGGIAGPLLFGGGFHIIKLEEIRTRATPYEKVKDEITKMLYEQKVENNYRTWLQSLRSDANIENKL